MKVDLFKNYLFAVMCALILIGYCENFVTQKFRPYIKYISGLFALIMIALPLFNSVLQLTDDISDSEITFPGESKLQFSAYADEYSKSLENAASDYICSKTELGRGDFSVSVKIDSSDISNIKTELITVKVFKKCDSSAIKRLVELWIAVPTEVICEYE